MIQQLDPVQAPFLLDNECKCLIFMDYAYSVCIFYKGTNISFFFNLVRFMSLLVVY